MLRTFRKSFDGGEDGYLFPRRSTNLEHIDSKYAGQLLRMAEELAASAPEGYIKTKHSASHSFRRLYRTERQRSCHDKDVGLAGGWSVEGKAAPDVAVSSTIKDGCLSFAPQDFFECAAFHPKIFCPNRA